MTEKTDLTTTCPVLHPGEPGYDEERTGFQLLDPHRPELVVAAHGEQDVREAIGYARAHGLSVAVQATGHGLTSAAQDAVLISTRAMTGISIDPATRTARIGAGVTWRQVIEASAPHGLAPLSGSFPGVGAVSYTANGGIGLLARRYGFAADHVRAVELVTADGAALRLTEGDELFWAVRGGGGNFGVITAMEIGLMPVHRLYGGVLYLDLEHSPDVIEEWLRWTETVPRTVTSALAMLPFPDFDGVPEPLRGKRIAQLQLALLEEAEDAERILAPLRALPGQVLDTVRELPYTESGAVFAEPGQPHAYRSANRLLSAVDPAAARALAELSGPEQPVMCVTQLRHLGGALAEPVDNAVPHREARYLLGVLSPVEPGQAESVRAMHRDALAPFESAALGPGLGFTFDELDEDTVRAGYGARYARLAALKAAHDPENLFRHNHTIRVS
ncbi:FAD-binding oxidoreductase [Sciscionella marina]|uniref:FAD-binding oxidoreductase n=1 Tax=Sciscionella marina TaxID=508770 RepID=UPI00037779A9|nr:FAD-binding oxidoreductase [Sciscionella marina]